jgi:hypothetical protein
MSSTDHTLIVTNQLSSAVTSTNTIGVYYYYKNPSTQVTATVKYFSYFVSLSDLGLVASGSTTQAAPAATVSPLVNTIAAQPLYTTKVAKSSTDYGAITFFIRTAQSTTSSIKIKSV